MLEKNNCFVNINCQYREAVTIASIKELKTSKAGKKQYKLLLWDDNFIIPAKTEPDGKNNFKFQYFYKNDLVMITYKYNKNGTVIITDIDYYNQ